MCPKRLEFEEYLIYECIIKHYYKNWSKNARSLHLNIPIFQKKRIRISKKKAIKIVNIDKIQVNAAKEVIIKVKIEENEAGANIKWE